ncbi:MAG: F0F1 ATP synthase subunit B [Planctomycetes bacterium]|nr:F0F1 ATP synthase subunit B [Planctomycetota bacterium]
MFRRVMALLVVASLATYVSSLAYAEDSAKEAHADADSGHGGHGAHDLGHGNAGAGLEDPSEFRTQLAIYTFVVFMLLLAILGKMAWPSIAAALEEREKRIEGNIADAEAKHEEAKQLLVQHEARLASAADEVRALMEEARRDAEHTKSQILAEAKQLADQERDRAVRDVERAADSAMASLAETSANLAVDLAGKVVKQNISAEQQAELVRDALSRLAASSPSQN